MWFIVSLIGYLLLATVLVMDKLILTKSVKDPAVFTFYSTLYFFALLLAWPFGIGVLAGLDWVWATGSGLFFGIALWCMFLAVKKEEASRINPFIGAIITVSTFLFARLFLHEALSTKHVLGSGILLLATCMFVWSKDRRSKRWNRGLSWGVAAGVCFALSHTSAKYIYDVYPFLTALVWTKASVGFVGVATLLLPSVRTAVAEPSKVKTQFHAKHIFALVGIDKLLAMIGALLVQYGIAIGSVTLVNAMIGIQYAFLFGLIFVLTKFAPRVFRETITKREYIMETAGLLLVVVGAAFFVM